MCGITGFCTFDNKNNSKELNNIINKMSNSLHHRGPDDKGVWIDSDNGVALGHKRLSIIDLSKSGHQPMISNNGRYVISFNGEIYNYKKLKKDLKETGYIFKSKYNTEVILSAIEKWGIINSLKKFDGMFAFGIWDRKKNELWLSRDKIGEKPLYYGFQNEKLFFGSELKSIISNPYFKPKINKDAVNLFLKYSYVPSPMSIFEGIYKLRPGHYINIKKSSYKLVESKPYWSLFDITKSGTENLFCGDENQAINDLERLLLKNIKSRMISDVPIGAFLSGGIDSSIIVSMMQQISNKPINTFTIGFDDQKFNEAPKAKKIAKYLGTNHNELYCSQKDALDIVPNLSYIYDEPFADSSQIPTNLVTSLAKNSVSVSLSGDGGDELFGGYNRYIFTQKYLSKLNFFPFQLRKFMSKSIKSIPINFVVSVEKFIEFFSKDFSRNQISNKFYKIGQILNHSDIENMYYELISVITDINKFSLNKTQYNTKKFDWNSFKDNVVAMQYLDLMNYHPDDILVKIDRASMNSSLETRVPFLSPDLIEFSTKLPRSLLFKNNQGKYILRKILNKYLPKNILNGPKIGFGVPINDWIRGPLNEWGKALISDSKLNNHDFLNFEEINKIWDLHQSKKFNYGMELWNVLMFQSWYQTWIKKN